MATAWVGLGNVTIGTTYSTITFDSISQSYKDLVVVVSAGSSQNGARFYLKLNNGVAGAVNAYQMMSAYGSTPSTTASWSSSATLLTVAQQGVSNYMQFMGYSQIFDYAATDKNKNVVTSFAAADTSGSYRESTFTVNTLAATGSVTRVDVVAGGAQFPAGSSFALYGIAG